ncbi:MAG: hypothetical protein FVQ81_12535 [Candidatus Glassbacteria bacterium]|nr:hypothetical protein [Candidatus Glassbacteria bacterium]
MKKKQIAESLDRPDYLSQLKSGELEYFHLIIQKLAEHDYQGMNQVAKLEKLDLGPVYKVLEDKTIRKLQNNETMRCYEFSLLIDMFGGKGRGSGVEAADRDAPEVDEDKLRTIYLELSGMSFSNKQAEKIIYYLSLWKLDHFYTYIFDRGLRAYFNERYEQLTGKQDSDLDIHEIINEVSIAEVLEEEKLLEDYVFDASGGSLSQEGLKEGLQIEKTGREEAEKLFVRLSKLLQRNPLDQRAVAKAMKDLHMDRRIKMIEGSGIAGLRDYLQTHAVEGAGAVMRRFGFALPEALDESDREDALRTINASLLSQSQSFEKGLHFLRWEGVLDHELIIEEGHCYTVHGDSLLLMIRPIEEVEHFLYGLYPLTPDRNRFIVTFLRHYLEQEQFNRAASAVIKHYLDQLTGPVRNSNAIRTGVLALPVVLIVAIMVGWIYTLTLGDVGEGVMLAVAILLFGEAIAARNGFSMEVRAENNEAIPDYASREQGVLKLGPMVSIRKGKEAGNVR